jgi:hypothetical protein
VIRINTQYDHLVCFTLVILKSPQRQLWDQFKSGLFSVLILYSARCV